jgi:hypothetical protein
MLGTGGRVALLAATVALAASGCYRTMPVAVADAKDIERSHPDRVVVLTRDGQRHEFLRCRVDGDVLEGDADARRTIRVPLARIASLEMRFKRGLGRALGLGALTLAAVVVGLLVVFGAVALVVVIAWA